MYEAICSKPNPTSPRCFTTDEIQANYQFGLATYLLVIIANCQDHQAILGYVQAQALRL